MKRVFTLLLASIALFSACSEGAGGDTPDPKPEPKPEPTPTQIPITISTQISRATESAFEQGDAIGVYVVNQPASLANSGNHVNNMRFTYSGVWTPDSEIYWKDETTKADFYCYYPYSTSANVTAHAYATKADQSTLANYKASDFLWGKTLGVTPTTNAVGVTVNHVFSKAIITVKAGDGFTDEQLAAASIGVKICGLKTNSTINLSTGEVTATGNASDVTPYKESGSYKALIVPQTVAEGALIVVTIDGVDYTLTKGFTFKSKTQHSFTVKVTKLSNGLNIGIGDWEIDETDNGGSAE